MAFVSSTGGIMEEAATRLNEISADEEDVYLNWVNLCTRDIARTYPRAPFLYASADRTLSSGVRHYVNFPSDFEHLINVTLPGRDIKLKYLTPEEFDAIQPSASETGRPTVYTLHGAEDTANTQIEFYPVPGNNSETVNYQYRKLPNDVSAQSAAPPIPLKYRDLYVLFLQKMALERREDFQQSGVVEAKYEAEKQRLILDYKRRTEEPWRVKSIREFTPSNRRHGDELVNLFWGDDVL